jgi:hypothetical protein
VLKPFTAELLKERITQVCASLPSSVAPEGVRAPAADVPPPATAEPEPQSEPQPEPEPELEAVGYAGSREPLPGSL